MLSTMPKPRILGGTAKGRELETPPSGTRPSPSRLREALFDVLAFEPRGRFLDLFSGSGAIGLEAASRGWEATCVELAGKAAEVIRRNAARLKLPVTVVKDDALAYSHANPGAFKVLFAAPPYPDDLGHIFATLLASGAVAPGGLYVLQHPTAMQIPSLPTALEGAEVRVKRYGTNSVTLVRVPAASELPAPAGS
jgi:16S rRNA (guanine(966)-N(2))-methyltransferase RsmD